jgi:hypothetical protein
MVSLSLTLSPPFSSTHSPIATVTPTELSPPVISPTYIHHTSSKMPAHLTDWCLLDRINQLEYGQMLGKPQQEPITMVKIGGHHSECHLVINQSE